MLRINSLEDLEIINPSEVNEYPGYFYYPEDHAIACNSLGVIINTKTGNILAGRIRNDYSTIIHVWDRDKRRKAYLHHRILARTFIGRPSRHLNKDFSELEVNHIDGNRKNFSLDNLEWVTCKENITHAHASRFCLRDRCVIALNPSNNKEIYFTSSKQCADHFGVKRSTFISHLSDGRSGKCRVNGFIFKFDDGSDWKLYPLNEIREITPDLSRRDMVIYDKGQDISIIYSGINYVMEYTKIKYRVIATAIMNKGIFENSAYKISLLENYNNQELV